MQGVFTRLRAVAAVFIAFLALPGAVAQAQDYPTKPVRWIVPYPPGGTADILARITGQYLSEHLGAQFIIDNRGGAGSNIGTEMVAKAIPDGYTLLATTATNTINETLYTNLNFDFLRDTVPVAGFARGALVLVVTPSFPAQTMPEFIAYAKANPGKVHFASAGIGTASHVPVELFKMMVGVDLVHVPYRSNAACAGGSEHDPFGGFAGPTHSRRLRAGLRDERVVRPVRTEKHPRRGYRHPQQSYQCGPRRPNNEKADYRFGRNATAGCSW